MINLFKKKNSGLSKVTQEVIYFIKNHPEDWTAVRNGVRYDGIERGDVQLRNYGNGTTLSIIRLYICGERVDFRDPMFGGDTVNLEKTCVWWYKQATTEQLQNAVDKPSV